MSFLRNILGNFNLKNAPVKEQEQSKFISNPKQIVEAVFRDFNFPNDIYQANKIIFGCFFYQSPPFTLWKSANSKLPENLEILTKVPCQFLMRRCWFWFLSENHGQVASRMIKDEFYELVNQMDAIEPKPEQNFTELIDFYFSKIDKAIELHSNASPDSKTFKSSSGEVLSLPWEYYLSLTILITSEDSPYYNKDNDDFEGNEYLIMDCLANARFIAEETFLRFKESYIDFDANSLKSWKWIPNAGLYEQHLKRRHNSIYFVKESREVTPYDVYIARCKDIEEWRSYYQRYLILKKEILDDDAPSDVMDFIIKKREEIDEVIDSVDRLGVGKDGLDVQLSNLRNSLIGIWRHIYQQQNNIKGMESLDKAEELSKSHSRKLMPDFINVMGHDSLPAGDVMSAYLSLSIDDLKDCINYLKSNDYVLNNLRTGTLQFVHKHIDYFENQDDLDMVRDKLAIIGVAL